MIPMPPCFASAIAKRASVTVSIGADTNGDESVMLRVSFVVQSISARSKSEYPGRSSTSLNVSERLLIFIPQYSIFTKQKKAPKRRVRRWCHRKRSVQY